MEGPTEADTVPEFTMALSPINLSDIAAGTGGFVIRGGGAYDQFGFSVGVAGDVNGDGFADLIIGAPNADPAGSNSAGRSYVVFGQASGFGASIDLSAIEAGTGGFVINGEAASDVSGRAVASAGDVNGDGFDDLIVGAYRALAENSGRAYVIFGQAAGFGASVDLSTIAAGTGGFFIGGQASNDYVGRAVASAGDINGDGFDDLLIGAPLADTGGGINAGKTYVVFGQAGPFGASIDMAAIEAGTGGFVINGSGIGDWSGFSAASAGDIDGDGIDDFLIGAYRAAVGGDSNAGKTYVIFGQDGGFGASMDLSAVAAGTGGFVIEGQAATDRLGLSVSSAGDVNGDGLADLVIGANQANPAGLSNAGKSYVVFGQDGGFGASVDLAAISAGTGGFVINGATVNDLSGFAVASAGDVNGDGFDDLLVSAPSADPAGKSAAGKSYVVFGQAGGFGASVDLAAIEAGTGGFVINGEETTDFSGIAASAAGDMDGDGFDDLLIGAFYANAPGAAHAGKAYVIFGRDFTASVTHAGTNAGETLTGTATADAMVGGLGHDILEGKGGIDALAGGAGNDTIKVADLTFQRVDGGSGKDTLALEGADIVLDLSTIRTPRIQDIEVIDLSGAGNNTLILSRREVLNLSSTSNTLRVEGNAGDVADLSDIRGWTRSAPAGGYRTFTSGQAVVEVDQDITIACFAEGTRILTPSGAIPVEALSVGDIVLTMDQGHPVPRPIVWLGHRRIDPRRHPDPAAVTPIRILPGALGDGVPARTLLVSPDHAMLVDGHLIPARLLVNGATILSDSPARPVVYFHIETDQHAVLLAEGAPAESYLDTGNRGAFEDGAMTLHPDFSGQAVREAACCLPFSAEAAVVEPAWRALAARAETLGYMLPRPDLVADPDLRVEVGGRSLRPVAVEGDCYTFVLPPGGGAVRLLSRASRPGWATPWIEDRRMLGVSVRRMTLIAGMEVMEIPLDHPGLTAGWWALEPEARWTNGAAVLPPIGEGGPLLLRILAGRLDAYAEAERDAAMAA